MATDTDARSGDVPSTSAARAEADDALAESKRMHFTYARHYVPPSSPTETDQPPSLASLGLTPLVDPRAVPDVLRAVLLEDGCVKVNFRDNTVLRLDATGSAFTVTTPEGETLRQLSEFAVTRFVRKLRSALEFRNKHADVPFLPPAIARLGGGDDDDAASADIDPRFRASARARYASWSLDAEDAERSGFLTRLEGGGAALESTDGIARVVLSAHGLVARVTYPLLFAVKDASDPESAPSDLDAAPSDPDAADAADAPPRRARRLAHDYVWHTQTFCADACPARWRFPVALLTRVVYGEGASAEKENAEKEDGRNAETAPGTKTTVSETSSRCERAGSVTTLPVSATALPRGVGLSHGLWVDEGDEHEKPWWSSPAVVGYPDARGGSRSAGGAERSRRRPTVERAPGQTSFAVRSREARSVTPIGTGERPTGPWVEVVSVLDADGDALVSADAAKFVVHVPDEPKGAAAARMYAVDAVPARVAPAGRAGAAFQAARAGGEFEASQGRSRGAEEGKGSDADDGVGARAQRVPLGRFAARVAALRAAAATPASDPEPPSSQTDAVSGVSLGRGATTDSDAAAWAEDPDPWSVLSADIVEESAGDPGSFAAFTAYADGRVRVKFADRTLLELRRDRQAARLLLPDGERVEVRASAPMRWGAYVTAASEFGRWAFLTPEARERAAEEERERDARVRAELDGIRRFAAMDAGVVPEPLDADAADATYEAVPRGASASAPSTPDRGPRAQPSAPTAPRSEARLVVSASSRSPLREARRVGGLSVSVPSSPLDGARIRSRESLEKLRRDWEEDDEKTKEPRSRASFAANVRFAGDDGADGERARGDGVGAVAAVAAGISAGTEEAASVANALAATSRWLEGVKDELSSGGEDGGDDNAPMEKIAPGAAARMDAVAAALDSNEKWLAGELEAKARDLDASDFDRPPDF